MSFKHIHDFWTCFLPSFHVPGLQAYNLKALHLQSPPDSPYQTVLLEAIVQTSTPWPQDSTHHNAVHLVGA